MKSILIVFALFALLSCNEKKNELSPECTEKPLPNVACTMQYDPVCGCNNKTYGNACSAQAMGITNFTKGECK